MTPSFHENETTLFRLKKSIYPFKENHPPQHERKKENKNRVYEKEWSVYLSHDWLSPYA